MGCTSSTYNQFEHKFELMTALMVHHVKGVVPTGRHIPQKYVMTFLKLIVLFSVSAQSFCNNMTLNDLIFLTILPLAVTHQ